MIKITSNHSFLFSACRRSSKARLFETICSEEGLCAGIKTGHSQSVNKHTNLLTFILYSEHAVVLFCTVVVQFFVNSSKVQSLMTNKSALKKLVTEKVDERHGMLPTATVESLLCNELRKKPQKFPTSAIRNSFLIQVS